ncbi:type I secretion system permease/ATPase [Azospirillum picis]|uniref:ATP-binding cassette subfamily C protein n=1 Tax=Azospirillum picis TaxID=488438 RepID=A0ABU0MU38_9PROT|nr:type I secretion system permease/ATPase [Azospirillum picis]MBP2300904.1 ATP-binding cassette subfamily C protein [Azospirillum picis]MDQ0537008.1 ATP-binding cassette subfamily C protein [Azospirillum picis]
MSQPTSAVPAASPLDEALRRCAPGMALAVVISLFTSIGLLIVPLYMMQIYDRVLSSHSLSTLMALTVVALGGLTLYAVLDYCRIRIYQKLATWLGQRLGLDAIEAIIAQTLRGKAGTQGLRDIQELKLFIGGNAATSALELLWSPLFFAVLFAFHPAYGVVAVASAAVLVVLALATELATRRSRRDTEAATLAANEELLGALRHVEVIDAMGMAQPLTRRWLAATDEANRLADASLRRATALGALSRLVRMAIQIGAMAVGVSLVVDNAASPGSLFAASIIVARALAPFEHIISDWRRWAAALGAQRRLRALLADRGAGRSTMELPRPEGILEIDRLVYVPPGANRAVLKGVSLFVAPGEAVGIVGPSASGKSTLARLLVGVWQPTGGAVRLDGHDVYLWNRENFGAHVGYLPQSVSLLDGTVRDNIARMGEADPLAVVTAAKRAHIHEMIGHLPHGYDSEIGSAGYTLSGGQRQRLALARALFGEPSLLVLDEPDANLDAAGEEALVRAVSEAKQRGCTIVAITHHPRLLTVLDKVAVMRDGIIEGVVTPTQAAARLSGRPPETARDGAREAAKDGAGAVVALPAAEKAAGEPKLVARAAGSTP